MSTERIIVQASVADAFRDVLLSVAKKDFGSSTEPSLLVSSTAARRTTGLVDDAIQNGAKVLYGEVDTQDGIQACCRPLILEGVSTTMRIYSEETFGPVVVLYTVGTDEEAISLANDTEYGLTSAVFTQNLARGLRMSKKIDSG